MEKYEQFRKEYPVFIYRGYQIEEGADEVKIQYFFETEGLSEYTPVWTFPKKKAMRYPVKGNATFEKLAFSLGMTELVSYWKITCSPTVRVLAGTLSEEQKIWWKDLYFNGLGEFFYINGIDADPEDFMTIEAEGPEITGKDYPLVNPEGCLIPIGGGKDSAVSIELMKKAGQKSMCYVINPRGATVHTAEVGGFDWTEVVDAGRTLDKRMIELNKKGFLNGHTPFSAIVAFSSVIAAYMHGLHYVALSNEDSANESTVPGSTVNHQYSKSFKFEQDFHGYEEKYIGSGVYYFSLLRPLSEFQIAKFFAACKAYHPIFRSCNAGSKEDKWCGHCSKCLFVFFILSPFLEHGYVADIFGRDMLEDAEMLPIMDQLTGAVDVKPFECVGSRDEINTAICLTIARMEANGEKLPLLFNYYKESDLYTRYHLAGDTFSDGFNRDNLLPEAFVQVVRDNCCGK